MKEDRWPWARKFELVCTQTTGYIVFGKDNVCGFYFRREANDQDLKDYLRNKREGKIKARYQMTRRADG